MFTIQPGLCFPPHYVDILVYNTMLLWLSTSGNSGQDGAIDELASPGTEKRVVPMMVVRRTKTLHLFDGLCYHELGLPIPNK